MKADHDGLNQSLRRPAVALQISTGAASAIRRTESPSAAGAAGDAAVGPTIGLLRSPATVSLDSPSRPRRATLPASAAIVRADHGADRSPRRASGKRLGGTDADARRRSTEATFSSCRYLVTVRRATFRPWRTSRRAICASESGSDGFSASIMPLMTPRIAVAEQAPPLAVAISREKKYLSSNTPTGVAMYLLLVTRETVDSCRPSSAAISRRPSGFIAIGPNSRKCCWRLRIASATIRMVEKRCCTFFTVQRASCRCWASSPCCASRCSWNIEA